MRWIPTTASPIGIDITARDIQAVQLRRTKTSARASAMVSIPRLDPETDLTVRDLDRLSSVLYRHGFAGRDIVLAVPENKLLSSMMELPPRNGAAPFEQI